MGATALTERTAANLHGVLSCYDKIIVTGTLPGACDAGGMTSLLYSRGIRIFDDPRFAEPLRERIRERAQQVCEAAGVQIEQERRDEGGRLEHASVHGSCPQRGATPPARRSAVRSGA